MRVHEPHRYSVTPGAIAALVLAIGLLLGGPGFVTAAAAETQLEVETPVGNPMSGREAVVVAEITSDRAISGSLTLSAQGRAMISQQVEVPGGSTKRFVLTAKLPQWMGDVRVVFDPDSGETIVAAVDVTHEPQGPVVAVFPSLVSPALPTTAEAVGGEGRRASLRPVEMSLLDAGSAVLDPVAAVALTPADFDGLTERQERALRVWLADGGHLLFDGSRSDLPSGIAPGPTGLGTVELTGQELAAGVWDGKVAPRFAFDEVGGFEDGRLVLGSLVDDAGLSPIPFTPVLIFLLLYVLVIGPGLWIMLGARGRRPATWLAVPALALLATGLIWGYGRIVRAGSNGSYASLYTDVDGVSTAYTDVLLLSNGGGYAGVELGDDWRPRPRLANDWNEFGETTQAELRGREYGADLPPTGVGLVSVVSESAGAERDAAWEVSITSVASDGASLAGTVTNRSGEDLDAVLVGLGESVVELGNVPHGDSREFEVPIDDRSVRFDRGQSPLLIEKIRTAERSGSASSAAFSDWYDRLSPGPGAVVVVGWTNSPGPEVEPIGFSLGGGRTGFASVKPLAGNDDTTSTLHAFAGSVRLISRVWGFDAGPGWGVLDGVGFDENGNPTGLELQGEFMEDAFVSTYNIAVDQAADQALLALALNGVFGLDYWDGTQWKPSGIADGLNNSGNWAVPSAAVDDGTMSIRIAGSIHVPRLFQRTDQTELLQTGEGN